MSRQEMNIKKWAKDTFADNTFFHKTLDHTNNMLNKIESFFTNAES